MAWTFRSQDGAANIQCTPIIVDGLLYAPTPGRAIVALDAATGVERWRKQMESPRPTRRRMRRRGAGSFTGRATPSMRRGFCLGRATGSTRSIRRRAITAASSARSGRTPIATGATASGRGVQARVRHDGCERRHLWIRCAQREIALAFQLGGAGRAVWRRHVGRAAGRREWLERTLDRRRARHRVRRARRAAARHGRRRPAGRQSV